MINNIIVIRRFTHTGLRFSILQTSLRRFFYFFPCDNKVERLVIYYGYKCRLLTFFSLGDIVARFRFFRRRFPGPYRRYLSIFLPIAVSLLTELVLLSPLFLSSSSVRY